MSEEVVMACTHTPGECPVCRKPWSEVKPHYLPLTSSMKVFVTCRTCWAGITVERRIEHLAALYHSRILVAIDVPVFDKTHDALVEQYLDGWSNYALHVAAQIHEFVLLQQAIRNEAAWRQGVSGDENTNDTNTDKHRD